jgi:sulfite reductase (NADPH) flavoprotein alpha-component
VGCNFEDAASLSTGTRFLCKATCLFERRFAFSFVKMSTKADSPYTKDNPCSAVITDNIVLNRQGSAKETRHIVVDFSKQDLHYKAGDSLGVFATNRPEEVEEILHCLGATGDELVAPPALKLSAPQPLRDVLFSKLALAGPTRKMIETLASKATAPDQKMRLSQLLEPESKEALAAFLAERHFVDLQETRQEPL